MYKVSEQIVSANKAGVESLATIANATFAGVERLAALNLSIARTVLESSLDNTRTLLAAKNAEGLVSLQGKLVKPDAERATAYSRRAYEIATETQTAVSKVVDAQVLELNTKLGAVLDTALKTAPVGSDLAVNAMRSALSAANSAYDRLSKTARQVTELAGANLGATAGKPGRQAA
jgi:phasin family protein